eukprot:CAMPEP_0113598054 /NCGR_PEP_ID=MMETSP0015_2-20120614/41355_1 /TAXON_ID=2838 /ORGANISM="Odontella" /LENGTH=67 /DNA_ID=CAMNT_0000505991 /DNA_START=200 /DNA_END=399 /DNA_ORIENTATION=+ /assembly_acc=CAM_ASM_000160
MTVEQNESEERAELLATIRAEHPAMKAWYSGPSNAAASVRAKLGEKAYPAFARDVASWEGYRETRRA